MTSRLTKLTNILLKDYPVHKYRTDTYRAINDDGMVSICPIMFSGANFSCSNCCLKDYYIFPHILTELGKVG